MSEPTLSSAALYKLLAASFGVTFASAVVMVLSPPKTRAEWFCAIVSTVFSSVSLGAYLATHFTRVLELPDLYAAQILGGLYFICGLPGWFTVRLIFHTMRRFQDKDALSILEEVKRD